MFWSSHMFYCNILLMLVKDNLQQSLSSVGVSIVARRTSLVVYCSKTMYVSSILLGGYAKHPDAQFPQQADEIHLYQGDEANQLFFAAV